MFALHQEVYDHFRSNKDEMKRAFGTGVFLIPDPATGPLSVKKVLVKGLTLEESQLRAVRCVKSTWVPDSLRSHDEIAALPCSQQICTGSGCQTAGCLCSGVADCM